MCRAVLSKCSYEILALIPWWCDGQRDLSLPVSPFNAVFKAVRREGIEGGLVTGLWFSSPQKLLASSAVAFACLLGGVERNLFVWGDHSASKCLQASRSPAELIALVIAPT